MPTTYWYGASGEPSTTLYRDPMDVALVYYTAELTLTPGLCPYGCSVSVDDIGTPTHLITKRAVVTKYNANGTVNSTLRSQFNIAPICPINYYTQLDYVATGANKTFVCRPGSSIADGQLRGRDPDMVNTQACVKGCNPVDLGDRHKTDWVVDYQNHSPYPIVWGRTFNGRIRRWIFNYDRSLAWSQGDATHAFAMLTRQDGQTVGFAGTLAAGVWTWAPKLDTTAKSSLVLATLSSNLDLTTFAVHTRTDETETYNAQGRLVSLQDTRALPLTFTYDTQGRLSHIADASLRTLDLTYPADPASQTVDVTGTGGAVTHPAYTPPFSSVADAAQARFPETVTDGTLAVGYVVGPNTLDTRKTPVLFEVIQADSTILTYNYNTASQYTGLTDENGDRYSTYAYTNASNDAVTQTQHGAGQETLAYTATKVTFPNAQNMTFSNDAVTLNPKTQTNRCSWCIGNQYKAVTYDAAGDPVSLTDFNNHLETRAYDTARGVPTSITQASGTAQARTITYTWDPRFLKPTVIVAPSQTPTGPGTSTITTTYDTNGNATAWAVNVTGPSSYSLARNGSATYNAFSEPLTITDARGKVTTFTYGTQGNRSTRVDALGHTTTYSGYDTAGNVGQVTDPNGLATVFTYDARQRITQIQKGCTGTGCHWETTTLTYNPMGALAKVVGPNGRGIAYHYDTAHRRTSEDVLDTTGAVVMGTLTYTLSVSSEVTAKTYKDAGGATIQTQGLGYDALSRLTAVIDSHTQTFGQTWDAQDNLTATTDPLSHGRTLSYDALDRLTQTTLPDTTTEQTGYGVDDTVTSQTDAAGHTTTQAFNGFGEAVSRVSPDSGTTVFTRDANGNALTQADARGITLTTTYDDLNRPSTQTGFTGGSAEQITWVYDTCTNGIGRLCSVTDRTGSKVFTYDLWGRVASLTQVTNAHSFTGLYAYDHAGQLTALTYPSGQVLTQTWTNGRVTAQQWGLAAGSGPAIFTNANYYPWDKLLGWTWASGRAYSLAYDMDGRVSAVGTGTGATQQTYTFDPARRLTGITRQPAASTTTFGYDSRDRLTSGSTWGSYSYDANSNRLTWLGTLGPQSYGMMAGSNQLATINSSVVITDAAGNLTSKPGLALTFDDWSRLRTATAGSVTTTYGVNGLNERVSKTDGVHTWVYVYTSPGHLLGVYDGNTGAAVEELAYLDERPVATARAGTIYPIETDHLMAPLRVLDASNAVVWSWEDREPFGATAPWEGTVGGLAFSLGLRFPGQWMDPESGLVSNGFRDYDPSLGRYVEVDPLGLAAGMNMYGYVGGNPVTKIDIFGLSEADVKVITGAFHKEIQLEITTGKRFDGWGSINNLLALSKIKINYMVCSGQSTSMIAALYREKYDDTWAFTLKSNLYHFWLEGTSSNKKDPILKIDPWNNAINRIE